MKVIKISDDAYRYITDKAKNDRRTIIATVDIIVEKDEKQGS